MLDNVISASFSETTKFVAAYGLNLSMLSYEIYFSKNTNLLATEVSGSTTISKISGLSTTPSSSSSKNPTLTFLLSWKPSDSLTVSTTCQDIGYPMLLPVETTELVLRILTVSFTLLPVL